MADLLPQVRLDLSDTAPANLIALFGADVQQVVLEIGFGAGEHLIAEAKANPQTGYLGAEPFINGVAKVLSAVDDDALSNIRLHNDDARALIEWLPDASLDRVDLLYPDPWPKTRHWKRRFFGPANLDRLARVMKPGAALCFATDITTYVAWALWHARRHPAFEWASARPRDWRDPWPGWTRTRYEEKAIREGRRPHYLTFRRA
ncbi:MAG: tRNA (guanine(46)-N(7))-methyltransferase TrmB [Pseudomonadota bacterium]